MAWHTQVGHLSRGAKYHEIIAWIDQTRGLSSRLPFGSLHLEMDTLANRMERVITSQRTYFTRFPQTVSTKADAQWRTSIYLWGMDRLVRAINVSEPEYAALHAGHDDGACVFVTLSEFWPAMFESPDPSVPTPPFADYKEAQKRVANLSGTIKPDAQDALMVSLLTAPSVIHPPTPPKKPESRGFRPAMRALLSHLESVS